MRRARTSKFAKCGDVLSERSRTHHSGDMVYTIGIWGEPGCHGERVDQWTKRLRFIARLLEGEKMAPLCREFGISRVIGYKIYERYKTCGLDGLNDRSRALSPCQQLPYQVERTILGIKKDHGSVL